MRGGAEFAHRLELETRNHLPNREEAETWDVVVGVYIDINGLLVKCTGADVLLSKESLMDFVCGFNQAQTFYEMVDVGGNREKATRKIAGNASSCGGCVDFANWTIYCRPSTPVLP